MNSLILLKPDALRRNLVSNILSRFERQDFEFGALVKRALTTGEVDSLYCQYVEQDFMPRLRGTMQSGDCLIATVSRPDDCIPLARQIALETRQQLKDPHETNPACNLIHASDCLAAAVREIHLFFGDRSCTRSV